MSSLTNFNLKKLFLKKLFWKCIKRALSTSLQLQLLILSNFWVLKAKSRELLSEEWLSLITWPQFNQWKSIHSQWRSFFCASFLQFWPPGYILTILIPNSPCCTASNFRITDIFYGQSLTRITDMYVLGFKAGTFYP